MTQAEVILARWKEDWLHEFITEAYEEVFGFSDSVQTYKDALDKACEIDPLSGMERIRQNISGKALSCNFRAMYVEGFVVGFEKGYMEGVERSRRRQALRASVEG